MQQAASNSANQHDPNCHVEALKQFKDWNNYLLVTAVAARGWVVGEQLPGFPTPKRIVLGAVRNVRDFYAGLDPFGPGAKDRINVKL